MILTGEIRNYWRDTPPYVTVSTSTTNPSWKGLGLATNRLSIAEHML